MHLDDIPGHIKAALSIDPSDYMIDRVIYKMLLYERLARRQRQYFHVTSMTMIVFSAAVPMLIRLQDINLFDGVSVNAIAMGLSLVVTILGSFEKLFHFREHWANYDRIAAELRSEQLMFQDRAGVYSAQKQSDDGAAFTLFVSRVESHIRNERGDTITMRTAPSEPGRP